MRVSHAQGVVTRFDGRSGVTEGKTTAAERRILLPREHGAWAVLLMGFVVGTGMAARPGAEVVLFLLAAVSFFAVRLPLGLALKARAMSGSNGRPVVSFRTATAWLLLYGTVGASAGGLLLWAYGRWVMVLLGGIAMALLALQPLLRRRRLDRTVGGELLVFAGLTLTAPGAYYASTGLLGGEAITLWLTTFLYAGAGVYYVKLRVRQRQMHASLSQLRDRWRLASGAAGYLTVAVSAVVALAVGGWVPALTPLAFVPLAVKMVRGMCLVEPSLNLRRLGLLELAHAATFAGLVMLVYALG